MRGLSGKKISSQGFLAFLQKIRMPGHPKTHYDKAGNQDPAHDANGKPALLIKDRLCFHLDQNQHTVTDKFKNRDDNRNHQYKGDKKAKILGQM